LQRHAECPVNQIRQYLYDWLTSAALAPPNAQSLVTYLQEITRKAGSPKMNYHAVKISSEPALGFPPELLERINSVFRVAAQNADAVDSAARHPAEALEALKAAKLMSILVPASLGGEGLSMADAAEICFRLGQACANTGMIYAMHLVKLACIVNHGQGNIWQQSLIRRIVSEQMLLASSTTEGMNGGNVRSSAAAITHNGSNISLNRDASVISYGAYADAIVTTARRSEDADASDQVLAVFLKEDYSLEATSSWNTLGMRGTCSIGYRLKAIGVADQVLPVAYALIHTQTMAPAAHILWSSVWAGIATAAVTKAELFVRKAVRASAGQLPPGGMHLTKAKSKLRMLRALLNEATTRYEETHTNEEKAASLDYQSAMALTKVEASEMAVDIVMICHRTCGLAGYRNDGEVSIGRHIRDILSSPIMISNDRILTSMGNATLMSGVPTSLRA
jgi:acyl-CoA dehydrogenase